jgi:hypothetical protein
MEKNISFIKYLLISSIGFGIAGLLWGWSFKLMNTDYPLTLFGGIFLGLFGGLGLLGRYLDNIKQILKTVGFGLIGGISGILLAFLGIYHLPLIFGFFLSVFFPQQAPQTINNLIHYLNIPQLGIFIYLLNFIIVGIIFGLFYALSFKIKLWPMIWRGGVGFALGSFIGPIVGNLIGGAMGSLLATYLITFFVISVVFGKFLAWGIYKNLNPQK